VAEEASKETREDGTHLAAEAEARRLVYVALTRAKESVVRGYGCRVLACFPSLALNMLC
jgi:ATP-dependent exoDNAse (exonuclease V) beta subunit